MFGGGAMFTQGGGSPEKPQKRADDRTNCLPVTIRMLDSAYETGKLDDGELRFHGSQSSPGVLTLVAQVEAVHALQGQMGEFTICDTTSRIRARMYGAEGEQEKVLNSLSAGMWVRLVGHFRSAPSPHISVSILRLVESADEISHHTIEVVHAALKCMQHNGTNFAMLETPPPKSTRPAETPDAPMEPAEKIQTPEKPKQPETRDMEIDAELTQKLPGQAPAPALEGTALRSAIMRLLEDLKTSGDEIGLTLPQILEAVEKKGAPVADGQKAVMASIDALVDEGEVFTTIDDEHWGVP